jgi:uncharacterized membrane protein
VAWVEHAARWIELAGVGAIIVGGFAATIVFGRDLLAKIDFDEAYGRYRAQLGRAILLGLEFLIAGDIIATIIVDQTLESVGVLAIVVLIRTFLSFSLETEIEGRPPWRKRSAAQAGSDRR